MPKKIFSITGEQFTLTSKQLVQGDGRKKSPLVSRYLMKFDNFRKKVTHETVHLVVPYFVEYKNGGHRWAKSLPYSGRLHVDRIKGEVLFLNIGCKSFADANAEAILNTIIGKPKKKSKKKSPGSGGGTDRTKRGKAKVA